MDRCGDSKRDGVAIVPILISTALALVFSSVFWHCVSLLEKVAETAPTFAGLSSEWLSVHIRGSIYLIRRSQMVIPPFVIKPKRKISPELVSSVPIEILELIFHEATWDTLKACSLVCRRWNYLTRSWPAFTGLTFVLDDQKDRRDCSWVAFHHWSTLRPRSITLVQNSLNNGWSFYDGLRYRHEGFDSIRSVRLQGFLDHTQWLPDRLVSSSHIKELDLDIQFFESVHSLFEFIASFEGLKTLRIACRGQVTTQFQMEHLVPRGRISPFLHTLSFGDNSGIFLPFFTTWFSSTGGLQHPIHISMNYIQTISDLSSFWTLLNAVPESLQSINITLALSLPLQSIPSERRTLASLTNSQPRHFTQLRAVTLKNIHPHARPSHLSGLMDCVFRPLLITLASESVQTITLSIGCNTPSMQWRALDEVFASCYPNLDSIRLRSECPHSHNSRKADFWQESLPRCSMENLIDFDTPSTSGGTSSRFRWFARRRS
ncbi:hypothetical protein BDN72DRAFT_835698 [Pluteus cervinus]|uniref:Uncharacterized protein n=1 Tax=Pluteus cervinus TaxID=181527 RepID=A0ACD3B4K0_9AGAR|nr:hypothetical protein BDN72DRAFT_835698 [Pluteus cervinus]